MVMRHPPGSDGYAGSVNEHPRQIHCCRSHWPRQATRRLRADSTASLPQLWGPRRTGVNAPFSDRSRGRRATGFQEVPKSLGNLWRKSEPANLLERAIRFGLSVMLVATVLSAAFALLGFGNSTGVAVAGTVLWGIGMGAQESIMRSAVASMTFSGEAGDGVWRFNLATALPGSVAAHFYVQSIGMLMLFSVTAQLLAGPCFVLAKRLATRAAVT